MYALCIKAVNKYRLRRYLDVSFLPIVYYLI